MNDFAGRDRRVFAGLLFHQAISLLQLKAWALLPRLSVRGLVDLLQVACERCRLRCCGPWGSLQWPDMSRPSR